MGCRALSVLPFKLVPLLGVLLGGACVCVCVVCVRWSHSGMREVASLSDKVAKKTRPLRYVFEDVVSVCM